jgi:lipopolysaccharide transport system permease protein
MILLELKMITAERIGNMKLFINFDLIKNLYKKELLGRYKNSFMGAIWIFISPMSSIFIYTVVLSNVVAVKIGVVDSTYSYGLYISAGIILWTLFSNILTRCMNFFIEHAQTLNKINHSKKNLLIPTFLVYLTDFFVMTIILFFVMIFSPYTPIIYFFPLLFSVIVLCLFAMSTGLLLGIFNLFNRDIGHASGIGLTFLFWATPIVYPMNILPDRVVDILEFNPLLPIITLWHRLIFYNDIQNIYSLLFNLSYPLILSLIFIVLFKYLLVKNIETIRDKF